MCPRGSRASTVPARTCWPGSPPPPGGRGSGPVQPEPYWASDDGDVQLHRGGLPGRAADPAGGQRGRDRDGPSDATEAPGPVLLRGCRGHGLPPSRVRRDGHRQPSPAALPVPLRSGGRARLPAGRLRRNPRFAAVPGLQQGHAAPRIRLPAAYRSRTRTPQGGRCPVDHRERARVRPARAGVLSTAPTAWSCAGPCSACLFRYHRLFETSFAIVASRGCDHSIRTLNPRYRSGPGRDTEAAWREAIGAAWTSQQGGREAVPVVYTEYIGGQLLETLKAAA